MHRFIKLSFRISALYMCIFFGILINSQAHAILADLNNDNLVDIFDLVIMAKCANPDPSDDPPECKNADLNGNGVIDEDDLNIVAACFNSTVPEGPTAVGPAYSILSGQPYTIGWTDVIGAEEYFIKWSTDPSFNNFGQITEAETTRAFSHIVVSDTSYYYRVAAINSCGLTSNWSNTIEVNVVADNSATIEITSLNSGSIPIGKLEPANINQPLVFAGYIKDSNGQPIGNESFDLEDPVSQVSISNAFTTDEDGFFIFRTDDNQGYSYVKQWSGVPGLYAFVIFKNSNIIGTILVPVNPKSNMSESDFQTSTSFDFHGVISRPLTPSESAWVHKIANDSLIPDPDITAKKSMTRQISDSFINTQLAAFDEWATFGNVTILVGLGAICVGTGGAGCPLLASFLVSSILVAEAGQFTDELYEAELLDENSHNDLRDILNYGSFLVSLTTSDTKTEAAIKLFGFTADEFVEVSVRRNENNGVKNLQVESTGPSIIAIEITDKNDNVYQLSFVHKKGKPRSIVPSAITGMLLLSDDLNPAECVSPPSPVLQAPSSINSDGLVKLNWEFVEAATRYEIEESPNQDFSGSRKIFTDVDLNDGPDWWLWTAPITNSGNKFYYRIRGIDKSGDCNETGSWSVPIIVNVVSEPVPNIDFYRVCKDSANCSNTQYFSVSDEWIYACTWWDINTDLTTNYTLEIIFYAPQGQNIFFKRDYLPKDLDYNNFGWCLRLSVDDDPKNYMKSNEGKPSDYTGKWDYSIYLDSDLKGSGEFYLE